ncbi:MAG: 4-(cytidine 5'-diphospho)-2-C-methyl-D-erythritol kinase [Pseudomonadota bacterium]|nr:4-(cytidine 5'-diphospho)-2-C-methyl-D-erythritol kinase [Pseudomonadota bacterium]
MIEHIARAKINLALHVTAQRADGYHEIDTLAGFADTGDRLGFEAAPDGAIRLDVTGPFARELEAAGAGQDGNIVMRAAEILARSAREAGLRPGGARIHLEKNLPVASGLGGGSADAAATLVGLRELWNLPAGLKLGPIAASLGADVPMCLVSAPLRARGIGEAVERLEGAGACHALLVNPRVAVSTPQVFAALARKANPAIGALPPDPFDPAWLATLRNDLEVPATEACPVIGDVLAWLGRQEGCVLARMSGSGATCYGLFGDAAQARAAHRQAVDTMTQWWSAPAEIAGSTVPQHR